MVPCVAVIDDDPFLLELMTEVLDERKWTALSLPESSPVYEWLLEQKPDVILLDVRLGGGQSGWDVLDQLQAHPETCRIPVVVWTADMRGVKDRQDWLRELGIPVIAKPFEIDELFRCLDDVLRAQKLRGEGIGTLSA